MNNMKEEKKKKRWGIINSHKEWKTIRNISNDTAFSTPPCLVNINQVAHQLRINGRGTKPTRHVLPPTTEVGESMVYTFSEEEYRRGIAALKNNKATGIADVPFEQLKIFIPKLTSACVQCSIISSLRRR